MSRNDAFQVEGVVATVGDNRTCIVELANGHRLTGFVTSRDQGPIGVLSPGSKVWLQMSPYDLSSGRIVGKLERKDL